MNRVRILDPLTVSKIAAGEVVERPASIVKELVENAIDAQAGRIEIEFGNGGRTLIRVTDDGCGMDREDLLLAVERHATSKISSLEDLERLTSLGFRGEALPSIAAVADLEIRTRPRGKETGHILEMRGGKMERIYEAGLPEGTTVIVTGLFLRIPARLKYLKSIPTEAGYIADVVGRLAIAHPGIAFRLVHHDHEILFTPGSGDPVEVITAIYGREIAREMIRIPPVEVEGEGISVSGFLGRPSIARTTRQYEFFFLNGRSIRNRALAAAVERAYQSLLPSARYPFAVLFLRLDPRKVDVNVHPAKLEVRFADESAVFRAVYEASRRALAGASLFPAHPGANREDGSVQAAATTARPHTQTRSPQPVTALPGLSFTKDTRGQGAATGTWFRSSSLGVALQSTYILARDEEGLLLVDQHAAHERILFERYESAPEKELSPQGLLIPATLELTFQETAVLRERLDLFISLGFRIEHFGGHSHLLRAVPAAMAKLDGAGLLRDLLDGFIQTPAPRDALGLRRATLATMACRAAVKAGDPLTPPEMEALLEELGRTETPFTCPHGRPTAIRISWEEIARRFARR